MAAVGVLGWLARRLRALLGLRLGRVRAVLCPDARLRLALAAVAAIAPAALAALAPRGGCAALSRLSWVSAGAAGSPIQGMVWPISRSIAATDLPSIGATMVMAVPLKPARPVRPMRWT